MSLAVPEAAPIQAPRPKPWLIAALAAGGVLAGLIAGELVAGGHSVDVLGLAVVLLPVAIWKRPHTGPIVLLVAAVLIEQVQATGDNVTVATGAALITTPHIPITQSIPLYRGIGSIHLEGADLLLLMIALIYLIRSVDWGPRPWPRSPVGLGVLSLLGAVLLGILIGLSHHGQLRVALMEARPYVYLAASFLLTSLMIRRRSTLHTALWAFVLAVAFKALQGLYVFVKVRSWHPRPEAVLGHEEAYLFAVYILLVLALWLFGVEGRLRKTATWLLPVVIGADLANNRRAAWLLLGFGLVVMGVIGYRSLPDRRRAITRVTIAVLGVSALYMPVYWNKDGGLAQPARAVRSIISPDPRDAASDLYRNQENANLRLNIRQGGPLGKGFGVPIDYALPIVDIKGIDPLITYIPHDGVLYVLMRMGILGAIAMWGLLAAGIIAGCRLARAVDRELAVIGALAATALVAYALEGAIDQGFFFYRIAFVTGCLLGLAQVATRFNRSAVTVNAAQRRVHRQRRFRAPVTMRG
jgi:hypothetical protein